MTQGQVAVMLLGEGQVSQVSAEVALSKETVTHERNCQNS